MKPKLSKERTNGIVKGYGSTPLKVRISLRKKLYDQRDSQSHKLAEKLSKGAKVDKLKTVTVEQSKDIHTATCNVFRTVYCIAKTDRPYTDHEHLIDLQCANGVNVGTVLHSNLLRTSIIEHISIEMKQKVLSTILNNQVHFSVLH